ncbi:MAG: hypothetical protein HY252_20130 [Sphingobacteriales bacterium]|nr:hypothetical protein [Sphingobacteriales bacterium]
MTAIALRKKLVDYLQVADEKKLKAIYTLLEDDIEQTGHISIEQYNKEIDEAEQEFKNGEYISHEAMKKKIRQW